MYIYSLQHPTSDNAMKSPSTSILTHGLGYQLLFNLELSMGDNDPVPRKGRNKQQGPWHLEWGLPQPHCIPWSPLTTWQGRQGHPENLRVVLNQKASQGDTQDLPPLQERSLRDFFLCAKETVHALFSGLKDPNLIAIRE